MFSNLIRKDIVTELREKTFDLLVIGGGITGSGITLDATTRGMNVALIEMQDFAAGTSSRSTKLVHGGLRYLKNLEFKVVSEVGKERAVVYENGPHITTPEWMLLPFYEGGTYGKFMTSIGLRMYDFLASVKIGERRIMMNKKDALIKEPLLKQNGLKGAGYYVEYRTDDARLTIEVVKAAVKKGAKTLNYSKVEDLLYENGKVTGVSVCDQLTGERYKVNAKKVINATGPWVDEVREMDGSKEGKQLVLTKGVHVVFDQSRFPLKQAIYFDTEKDNRMIFAVPRGEKVYVGTTDTFYEDNPISPQATEKDIAYLIDAVNYMFPNVSTKRRDVESSWAGVRPLILEEGKDPSEISRKDEIWESSSGLITIAGGKLTGYRKMSQTIVDLVAEKFKSEENILYDSCQTKNLPISGGDVGGAKNFPEFVQHACKMGMEIGLSRNDAQHLASFYGSNVQTVYELLNKRKWDAERFGIPLLLFAKLIYAIEHEMIATPIDFFYRRTGSLLFDIHSVEKWKGRVCKYMSNTFNWTESRKSAYLEELEAELEKRHM